MRKEATPLVAIMHDHANIDPAGHPSWGPVGSWMWWGWSQLNPASGIYSWDMVDAYLDRAAELGKPVALSVIPLPGPDQDTTPAWVYGGGAGWDDGNGGTYPGWNSWAWDQAFATFVAAFGERYDGDPRVHSVWICTAMYGETVTNAEGCDLNGHNPGRFFNNALSWYAEAFPTTPLFLIATGPTNRLSLCQRAWELGVNVKFNGLVRDARNQHGVQYMPPGPGGGLMDIAQEAVSRGLPMAWEHAYAITQPKEAYRAMLTGLANGMTVFDTEIVGLQTIAELGIWDWLLDVMAAPPERVAMWVARDTTSPPPGNQYESGYPGPWVRGDITASAKVYAPGSAVYKVAPTGLTSRLEGHGGIGEVDPYEGLWVSLYMPAGNYRVEAVVADSAEWETKSQIVTVDGVNPEVVIFDDVRWVHRVVVTPTEDVPLPPPPEPPSLEELTARVEQLEADYILLLDAYMVQGAELRAINQKLAVHIAKIVAIEAKLGAASEALE